MNTTELMPIKSIKGNPKNPRIIKDDKFKKLVKSLQDFPEMANVRPVVCNTDMVILGGNMRWKAAIEAGWKEIPVTVVDWPEDKQQEFVIKDNVIGGQWNWGDLANEWDVDLLNDWGFEFPDYSKGLDVNDMTDEDVDLEEDFDPVGLASGLQRVVFIFDGAEEAESYLNSLNLEFKKRNMAWQVNMSNRDLDGK